MRRITIALALFLGASTMHSQCSALNRPQPVTLNSLRNSHRPLLVFAPDTDRTFPLSEAKAAFKHLQSGSHFGKVVLSLKD